MANQTPLLFTIIITILFLSLSCQPHTNASAMDCDENDRQALLKIKEEMTSPPSLWDWIPKTNCCTWGQVQCNDKGRVNSLTIGFASFPSDPFSTPGPPQFPTSPVTVPPAIGYLSALETLIMNYTPFYGHIPPLIFANLSQLQSLTVILNSIAGPIPDFRACRKLKSIVLFANKFSGPIPSTLSALPNLEHLYLKGNQLTGSIPRGLFHRSKKGTVLSLNLANNHLTGNMPELLVNGYLQTVDVSNNNLTGAVKFLSAPRMGPLEVNLQSNYLRFDFTNVTLSQNMSSLILNNNRIWGSIPGSLNDLKELNALDLANNQLCGKIPTGEVMSRFSAGSYVNNKCLCGTPLPPCSN